MQIEPPELADARALLERFEGEMSRQEGLMFLSDALSLLSDIRDDAASAQLVLVASNIAFAYAKRVQRAVDALLDREPTVHWETINHWRNVFDEFEVAGFELPQDVVETRSMLLSKKTELMPASEREELLKRLQAEKDKGNI